MSSQPDPVESLFAAAAELTGESRKAFLDRECAGHEALRRQVDGLLRAHDRVNHVLDQPVLESDELAATCLPDSQAVGTIIAGRYKLLEQIGDGGMGTVWMAEQKEPVKRLVAVKLIKAGMDSKAVLARFEAERQALALMDHPNIAKVHDAGTDDNGRPYFVMELVRGLPLTEYCDVRKLSVDARLDLFVHICSAVQHAHQKAIIHRDLKPTNVLVTEHDGKPMPKVIDFGLAKALNSSQMLTDRTLHTAYGTVVGTPLYMAPEQVGINALDVDTRTDIYALGVILYELLTGTTPLEKATFKAAAWEEMKRLIRDVEPPRPSTRLSSDKTLSSLAASRQVDASKLPGLIRGELDWIVMKALEKDRTRRYETASGFARDVQRYLKGDTVEACPPTLGYRIQKAYRRNKSAVLLASTLAAVMLIATGVSIGFAVVASRAKATALSAERAVIVERDQANQLREQAETERDSARAARTELRQSHYLAAMSLIPNAWKADNVGRVVELLDDQRPRPEDHEDMRGFEWHYWDRLCRSQSRELSLGSLFVRCNISGDGSRAVVCRVSPNPTISEPHYRIEILDLTTGQVVREIANVQTFVSAAQLNHDGSRLVTMLQADKNFELIAFDVASGREITRHAFDNRQLRTKLCAISPSGRRVAVLECWGGFAEPSKVVQITTLELGLVSDPPKSAELLVDRDYGTIDGLCFSGSEDELAYVTTPSQFPGSLRIIGDTVLRNTGSQSAVHLIDVATSQVRKVADVDARWCAIAFTPDGQKLTGLTAQPEQLIHWDISVPDRIEELSTVPLAISSFDRTYTKQNPQLSIRHSPDGQALLLRSRLIPNAWVFDTDTGRLRQTMKCPNWIRDAAFANGGSKLRAICPRDSIQNTDQLMLEWNITQAQDSNADFTRKQTEVISSRDGERQAIYLPKEQLVSIRNRDGLEMHSFAVPALKQYLQPSMQLDRVETNTRWFLPGVRLTFSRNGQYLCVKDNTGSFEKAISILETDTGRVCWKPEDETVDNDPLSRVLSPTTTVLSPDQRYVARCGPGKVVVISLDDPNDRFEIETQARSSVTFSPDGQRLIVEDRQSSGLDRPDPGRMQFWDLALRRLIRSEDYGPVTKVFSKNNQYFATVNANSNKILHFGDAVTGVEIWNSKLIDSNNDAVAIHPYGSSLVTFGFRFTNDRRSAPTVWDATTGKVKGRLEGAVGNLLDITYSPDGNRIATLSNDTDGGADIRLWDVNKLRELLQLKHRLLLAGKLTFSSDGHKLTYKTDMIPEDPTYIGITWDATPLDVVKE